MMYYVVMKGFTKCNSFEYPLEIAVKLMRKYAEEAIERYVRINETIVKAVMIDDRTIAIIPEVGKATTIELVEARYE